MNEAQQQVRKLIEENTELNKAYKYKETEPDHFYRVPWDVAKFLFPAIEKYAAWNESPERHTVAEYLIGMHMESYFEKYEKWMERMLQAIDKNGGTVSFGDADLYVEKLVNTTEKQVLLVRNVCTCSDEDTWLVVRDHDSFETELHVRVIARKASKKYDAPKPLSFYKKRDYSMDGDGIYGDMRDPGFVISYKRYNYPGAGKYSSLETDRLFHFYNSWRHFTYQLCWSDDGADEILGTN